MRGHDSVEFRRALAITIKPRVGDAWPVEAVLQERARTMPVVIVGSFVVDEVELRGLGNAQEYGTALGAALFRGPIRDVFIRALGGKDPLHVLLSVDAPELRPLLWERLCGPTSHGFQFLGLNQRVAYSRHIPSPVEREFKELRRSDLRALALIACPDGLLAYGLTPFDVEAAAASIRDGLQGVRCDFLGPVAGAVGPATLAALCQTLTRGSYAILHVVAHGRARQEPRETLLFLEQDGRGVDVIEKHELIARLGLLAGALPHLVFFAACESGVEFGEDSMGGLARGLVGELGIPAVLAMSSRVRIATAETLTRLFYTRLQVHGHVDEALVEACGGLVDRDQALVPALYSRLGPLPLFLTDEPDDAGSLEPEWSDPELRDHAILLGKAYDMRDRLAGAGQSTDSIDTDISSLRMRLRKDGGLHPGDLLGDGRYLLLALVGEGMTSSVWKAHDRRAGRLVAVKVLHPQHMRRPAIVRQFKRAAERMQALDHPNIIRVLAPAVLARHRLYMVVELYPNGTLHAAVRRRRLPAAAILTVARALGSALAHAHARKLLHRDVEPANVLFDADDRPVLIDFDLALDQGKILATGLSHVAPAVYIAPECHAERPEARPETDIYGLAMTILFMYAGVTPVAALRAPRAFMARLPCPPPVRRALLRAIAFDPNRRYPTMDAFLAALDAAELVWWRRRESLALLVVLVVVLVLVALL